MSFTVDKQTLEDLNLLGKYKAQSIFSLFSHTQTRKGGQLLESMFQYPFSDVASINERSDIFNFFQSNCVQFPLDTKLLDEVEYYLSNSGKTNMIVAGMDTIRCKFMHYIGSDKEYPMIQSGILATAKILRELKQFVKRLKAMEGSGACQEILNELEVILGLEQWTCIYALERKDVLSTWETACYDHLLRCAGKKKIQRLLEFVYEIDVYISVSTIARERGFTYAKAIPYTRNQLHITGLYHPQLTNPIANTVHIDHDHNVFFLTGANMAGKSTLMKSVGVSLYLAHMGFPVSAEKMEFCVYDGIYTSINVSDNLMMGYSHFYAEVLRVKKVAEAVHQSCNLLIIFDELFKGTNVKDAYDATVAVTEAFSKHQNCSFIISTHIIEAGETLRERCENMSFFYVPTLLVEGKPVYTYKLKEGITDDRHGMMIINNERIVEIIKKGVNK